MSQLSSTYTLRHMIPRLPAGLDIENICDRLKDNGDLLFLGGENFIWREFENIQGEEDGYTPTITSGVINGIVGGLIRIMEETRPSLPPSAGIYQIDEEQLCWAEFRVHSKPTSCLALREPSEFLGAKEIWYNNAIQSTEGHKM